MAAESMEAFVIGSKCCSVPECNSSSMSENVALHCFPHNDAILMEKWKRVLKIQKPIKKSMAVCSKHFLADDYEKSPKNTRRRRLKSCAIPSLNLPFRENDTKRTIKKLRIKRCNKAELLKDLSEIKNEILTENPKHAVTVSTLTDPIKFNFLDVFAAKNIQIFIGVDRNTLAKIIENVQNILKLLKEDGFADVTGSVLLVLLRLKLNLSFSCLSELFDVSTATLCSAQFSNMLSILYEAVQEVEWPTKNKMLKKMEKYIYKGVEDLNCIVDNDWK